jgi:hypothetical protein
VSIAGISVVRYTPVTPIAPVSLGDALPAQSVQPGDGGNAGVNAPSQAAPPPGMGAFVDKTV